jgi:hypothetical protein
VVATLAGAFVGSGLYLFIDRRWFLLDDLHPTICIGLVGAVVGAAVGLALGLTGRARWSLRRTVLVTFAVGFVATAPAGLWVDVIAWPDTYKAWTRLIGAFVGAGLGVTAAVAARGGRRRWAAVAAGFVAGGAVGQIMDQQVAEGGYSAFGDTVLAPLFISWQLVLYLAASLAVAIVLLLTRPR